MFNEQVTMFYGLGVGECLEVSGTQTVTGSANFGFTVRIRGDAIFDSKVTVVGPFTGLEDHLIGNHAPSDSLTVNAVTSNTGLTTITCALDRYGATTLHSTLAASGATTLSSILGVTQDATLGSDLSAGSVTDAHQRC